MTTDKQKILMVTGSGLHGGNIPQIIDKTFKQLGHETLFMATDDNLPYLEALLIRKKKQLSRMHLSLFNRRLYKAVRAFRPDIIMVYGSNWLVRPEMIGQLKKEFGCKVALWEGNFQFWRWFQGEALRYYDCVLVNDSYAVPMLTGPARVKNVHHMPFNMCDPDLHLPQDLTDEERAHYGSDIGTIGQGHLERRELFEEFIEFDMKLWGKFWNHSKVLRPFFMDEPVGFEEKLKIFQCTKIQVNLQSQTYQINGFSAKIFEIAACGGFFLTERKKDIALFFKDEEDLISFSSIDELKEKIRYFLSHPKERMELAAKIRERVVNDYTYRHKLTEVLSAINT